MRAFMLRGQSSGVMHDRVFHAYPSEEDFKAALAVELELHGVVFETVTDKAGVARIVGGAARERWVRIQPTEVVDGHGEGAPLDDSQRVILRGKLDPEGVARIVEAATRAPVNQPTAAAGLMSGSGTGTVRNRVSEGERVTLTAEDVATFDAADLIGAAPVSRKK